MADNRIEQLHKYMEKYCDSLREDQYFFFCMPKKLNPIRNTLPNFEPPELLNGSSTQLVTYISELALVRQALRKYTLGQFTEKPDFLWGIRFCV